MAGDSGDGPNYPQVFVLDRVTGITTLVSRGIAGLPGNEGSNRPSISADGRFVVFDTEAANLVPGDTDKNEDVVLWDRNTGELTLVSASYSGLPSDNYAARASISADGRSVVFDSAATNLVPGDSNGYPDVFIWDRGTGQNTLVSQGFGGAVTDGQARHASISANGDYVAFDAGASNLVADDSDDLINVFLWNRAADTITLISRTSTGAAIDGYRPSISGDGRFIAFETGSNDVTIDDARNHGDVFLRDRAMGTTSLVSRGMNEPSAGESALPAVSGDGRYVTFISNAWNLVPGDTNAAYDAFVWDRLTNTTKIASRRPDGTPAEWGIQTATPWTAYVEWLAPSVSADGQFVVFHSMSSNLVLDDTNLQFDIFMWHRG